MTEAEWLACGDPDPLLGHLGLTAGTRRLRLFAAGCCRLALNPFAPPAVRLAVLVVERVADRPVPPTVLDRIRKLVIDEAVARVDYTASLAKAARFALDPEPSEPWAAARWTAEATARAAADAPCPVIGEGLGPWRGAGGSEYQAERSAQAALARCVFGNPFRPVAVDPRWLTVGRAGHRPRHLRGPGVRPPAHPGRRPHGRRVRGRAGPRALPVRRAHVRGCWVVDLVLGKE